MVRYVVMCLMLFTWYMHAGKPVLSASSGMAITAQVGMLYSRIDDSKFTLDSNGLEALYDLMGEKSDMALVTGMDLAVFCNDNKDFCKKSLVAYRSGTYYPIAIYTHMTRGYHTVADLNKPRNVILVPRLDSEADIVYRVLAKIRHLFIAKEKFTNEYKKETISKHMINDYVSSIIEVYGRNKSYLRQQYYEAGLLVPLAIDADPMYVELADYLKVPAYVKGVMHYRYIDDDWAKGDVPIILTYLYLVTRVGSVNNDFYKAKDEIFSYLESFDVIGNSVNQ